MAKPGMSEPKFAHLVVLTAGVADELERVRAMLEQSFTVVSPQVKAVIKASRAATALEAVMVDVHKGMQG